MKFNLGQEVLRATEAWLAANQVGVPESIKIAAQQDDRGSGLEPGPADARNRSQLSPVSAAPLSGPCVECKQETEDRHGGDWLHDGCAEQLNEEYERDCRLDSPTHYPYGRRR